jgi:hypothetical protein
MQKVLAAGGNTERAWTSSSWRSFIGPHVFRTVENVTAREYINCNSSSPAISPAAFPPLDPKPMLAMPCDQALLSFAGTPHEASPADAADGVRSLSFWHAKLISVRPTGFLWALFRHCQWIVEVGSKSKAGMKCVDGVPTAAQSQPPYYRDKSWMLRPCGRYVRF